MGFYKVSFSMNLQQMVSLANLTYALWPQALHTKMFGFSIILVLQRHLVFSLTVVGRRVLPLEGGRGESMTIVGCRLTVGPTTCSVSTFAGKKGVSVRKSLTQRKMIKGQENHSADWNIFLGLKGGALYIRSEVCFPAHSFARVWRQTS